MQADFHTKKSDSRLICRVYLLLVVVQCVWIHSTTLGTGTENKVYCKAQRDGSSASVDLPNTFEQFCVRLLH